jgi:hypothetical protein
MDHRYRKVEWGPHGERKRTSVGNWKKPIKWNADASALAKALDHFGKGGGLVDSKVVREFPGCREFA